MTVHPALVCVLLLYGPTLSDTEPCTGASTEAPLPDPGSDPLPTLLASEPDQPSPSPTEPSASADPCSHDPEPLVAPPEALAATPTEELPQGRPGQQEQPEPPETTEHGWGDEPPAGRSPTDPRGTGLTPHRPTPASPEPSEKDGPASQGPGPGQGPPAERAAATVPGPASPEPTPPEPTPPGPEDGLPNPVGHFAFDAPTPSGSVTRVIGTASTTLLFLLGIGVLALRLTVGWPRFPTLSPGRRRSGTAPSGRGPR